MKPIHEYKNEQELIADAVEEKLSMDQRRALLSQFAKVIDKEAKINHTQARIEVFIKKNGSVYRSQIFKRLRLDRVGNEVAEEALNRIYIGGHVSVQQGPVHLKGGRRGVLLSWVDATVEMSEERYQQLVAQALTDDHIEPLPAAMQEKIFVTPATLSQVVELTKSFPDIAPVLPAGSQEPALDAANAVMKEILSKPSGHRFIPQSVDPIDAAIEARRKL